MRLVLLLTLIPSNAFSPQLSFTPRGSLSATSLYEKPGSEVTPKPVPTPSKNDDKATNDVTNSLGDDILSKFKKVEPEKEKDVQRPDKPKPTFGKPDFNRAPTLPISSKKNVGKRELTFRDDIYSRINDLTLPTNGTKVGKYAQKSGSNTPFFASFLKTEGDEAKIASEKKTEADGNMAEKAEAEKIAAEKADAERIAAEKAEAERIAAEKAEAEKIAAEKAEAERVAAEKKAEAEKAEASKLAAEKAAADKKIEEGREKLGRKRERRGMISDQQKDRRADDGFERRRQEFRKRQQSIKSDQDVYRIAADTEQEANIIRDKNQTFKDVKKEQARRLADLARSKIEGATANEEATTDEGATANEEATTDEGATANEEATTDEGAVEVERLGRERKSISSDQDKYRIATDSEQNVIRSRNQTFRDFKMEEARRLAERLPPGESTEKFKRERRSVISDQDRARRSGISEQIYIQGKRRASERKMWEPERKDTVADQDVDRKAGITEQVFVKGKAFIKGRRQMYSSMSEDERRAAEQRRIEIEARKREREGKSVISDQDKYRIAAATEQNVVRGKQQTFRDVKMEEAKNIAKSLEDSPQTTTDEKRDEKSKVQTFIQGRRQFYTTVSEDERRAAEQRRIEIEARKRQREGKRVISDQDKYRIAADGEQNVVRSKQQTFRDVKMEEAKNIAKSLENSPKTTTDEKRDEKSERKREVSDQEVEKRAGDSEKVLLKPFNSLEERRNDDELKREKARLKRERKKKAIVSDQDVYRIAADNENIIRDKNQTFNDVKREEAKRIAAASSSVRDEKANDVERLRREREAKSVTNDQDKYRIAADTELNVVRDRRQTFNDFKMEEAKRLASSASMRDDGRPEEPTEEEQQQRRQQAERKRVVSDQERYRRAGDGENMVIKPFSSDEERKAAEEVKKETARRKRERLSKSLVSDQEIRKNGLQNGE